MSDLDSLTPSEIAAVAFYGTIFILRTLPPEYHLKLKQTLQDWKHDMPLVPESQEVEEKRFLALLDAWLHLGLDTSK